MPEEKKHFMEDPYFKRWMPVWHHNSMENYPTIKKDFKVDENNAPHDNRCISGLLRPANRPCIVLGSGPSLDEAYPLLKNWKHPIFASTTNAMSIVHFDREPEFINAFDSLHTLFDHLNSYHWPKSTLLTHPYSEPRTIKWWKGPKYYYRRYYPDMEFSTLILPLMYPWIRVGLRVSGCVVNTNVSIADFLGYNPIFLVGVDFGWTDDDKEKSVYYKLHKKEWIIEPPIPRNKWPHNKNIFICKKNGKRTFDNAINFKNSLLHMWTGTEATLIDCSDGIIYEMPKVDIKDVIKKQGIGFNDLNKTKEEKMNIFKEYIEKLNKKEEFLPEDKV